MQVRISRSFVQQTYIKTCLFLLTKSLDAENEKDGVISPEAISHFTSSFGYRLSLSSPEEESGEDQMPVVTVISQEGKINSRKRWSSQDDFTSTSLVVDKNDGSCLSRAEEFPM